MTWSRTSDVAGGSKPNSNAGSKLWRSPWFLEHLLPMAMLGYHRFRGEKNHGKTTRLEEKRNMRGLSWNWVFLQCEIFPCHPLTSFDKRETRALETEARKLGSSKTDPQILWSWWALDEPSENCQELGVSAIFVTTHSSKGRLMQRFQDGFPVKDVPIRPQASEPCSAQIETGWLVYQRRFRSDNWYVF